MRLICNNIVSVITICILAILMCSTGCRSQGSVPKLADLAWWKKDDSRLASTPPPPASHFNPEPTVEMLADNTADKVNSLGTGTTTNATRGDNKLKSTTNENQLAGSPSNGSPAVGAPIRKPYQFAGASNSTASNGNAFDASAGSLKTSLPDWNPTARADSSNISQVQKGLAESLKGPKESNDNANKVVTQSNSKGSGDFAKGWKNDFALPSNTNVASSGASEFQPNLAHSAPKALQPVVPEPNDLQNESSQAVNQFAGSMGSPQSPRVAQAQPLYPQFNENELPDNSLRAANQQTPLPGGMSNRSPKTRAYQSTPFGAYSASNEAVQIGPTLPAGSPNSAQASFISIEPGKNGVSNSASPNSFGVIQATGNSTVPASIMQGSGSFAPGSVSPLIPNSK